MYTKKRIEVKINGRGSETRTHTGRILSPLSLPLDYAPLPFGDRLNSFFPIMLPPVEAFIHHSMTAVVLILNLTKNLVGFSVANGESVIEHLRFLSDYRFILHQKWNNVHQKVEEAVGFEPTVPCGTTVFKTVSIDLSDTLPIGTPEGTRTPNLTVMSGQL